MEISILLPVCLCTRAYFFVTLGIRQIVIIIVIMIDSAIQIKKFEGCRYCFSTGQRFGEMTFSGQA